MFSKDKYLDKYKSLCGLATDSDTLSIYSLRKLVLFRTIGLCPAGRIVSAHDGVFLTATQICNESTYALVKRKSVFDRHVDLEEFVENARQLEVKSIDSSGLKCALGNKQRQELLHQLAELHKDDCRAFRQSLLKSHALDIRAIHLCRWDGSPRKSISEIRDAICLYPTRSHEMKVVLKYILVIAATALLGYGLLAVPQHSLKTPGLERRGSGHNLPPGARIKVMKGDGNCLFRALGDQIVGLSAEDHVFIRHEIVEYIRKKPDFFKNFLDEADGDIDTYLKHMAQDGKYGGDLELEAAAKIYNATIVVYHPDGHNFSYSPREPASSSDRMFHLLYSTIIVDQGHYDSITFLDSTGT